ncbi:unnamed protein product [Moneuplotes crassus]|uniref:C2H2-type domain-containing protein n=1 Tax=Euplotes crassus TaxID=5936 RepID=A0AAD1XL09_EUPCR|nr:unnamed protein product [Moneuplotes crassus]
MYFTRNKFIAQPPPNIFKAQPWNGQSIYCSCDTQIVELPISLVDSRSGVIPVLLPPTTDIKIVYQIPNLIEVCPLSITKSKRTNEAKLKRLGKSRAPVAELTAMEDSPADSVPNLEKDFLDELPAEIFQTSKSSSREKGIKNEDGFGDEGNMDFLRYPKIRPHLSFIKDFAHSVSYSSNKSLGKKRIFHCEFGGCCKSFDKVWNFINHARMHLNMKPYKCETCGRGFTQKGNLKIHQKVHA